MKKLFIVISILSIFFSSCATVEQSNKKTISNNGANFYSSAVAYLGVKNYELAKANFLKAIKMHYNIVGAYYYLGIIEYTQKNFNIAEKYLLKCVKLNDKITDAHNTLGAIYAQKKEYKKAIEEFKKVLNDTTYLYPENALYNLALLHYNLKQYKKSIEYCNRCLYIVPKSPAVYYLLGLNYFQMNNIPESKYYLLQIIKEFQGNIWASKAKIFLKQNKMWKYNGIKRIF